MTRVKAYLERKLTQTFRVTGPRDVAITLGVFFVAIVALLWLVYAYPEDDDPVTVDCTYDADSASCTRY